MFEVFGAAFAWAGRCGTSAKMEGGHWLGGLGEDGLCYSPYMILFMWRKQVRMHAHLTPTRMFFHPIPPARFQRWGGVRPAAAIISIQHDRVIPILALLAGGWLRERHGWVPGNHRRPACLAGIVQDVSGPWLYRWGIFMAHIQWIPSIHSWRNAYHITSDHAYFLSRPYLVAWQDDLLPS